MSYGGGDETEDYFRTRQIKCLRLLFMSVTGVLYSPCYLRFLDLYIINNYQTLSQSRVTQGLWLSVYSLTFSIEDLKIHWLLICRKVVLHVYICSSCKEKTLSVKVSDVSQILKHDNYVKILSKIYGLFYWDRLTMRL